jgi:hypothetical protein
VSFPTYLPCSTPRLGQVANSRRSMDAQQAAAPAGNLGKYDLCFDLGEPECYRQDGRALKFTFSASHFALDTAAHENAALVRE